MHQPSRLNLPLHRSRRALTFITVSHMTTAALLMWLPWPFTFRLAAIAAVAIACVLALRSIIGNTAAASIQIGIDRRMRVTTRAGRQYEGEVLGGSYVGARITTIVWRPDGGRFAQSILILPDSLAADDFRRLRVVLRYGRALAPAPGSSDATAG